MTDCTMTQGPSLTLLVFASGVLVGLFAAGCLGVLRRLRET